MPTRHRPQPEFPIAGFLGPQRTGSGAVASELNITMPHPTEFGQWTNSPLLVPGQQGTDALLSGMDTAITDEQYQRAIDFAAFLQAHGVRLPEFSSEEDAVHGAEHRHKGLTALSRVMGN